MRAVPLPAYSARTKVGFQQTILQRLLPALFALGTLLAPPKQEVHANEHREANTGLTLVVDDDLLSAPGRDRDYTGGLAFTFSGDRLARRRFSLDPALGRLDRWFGAAQPEETTVAQVHRALTVGVMAFTPRGIGAAHPLPTDRPYASLLFLSNARRYLDAGRGAVYNTQLAVGALGLGAVGAGHRYLHEISSSDPVRGYRHQISAGGEPTLRYSLARQAPLGRPSVRADLKWTVGASVGTVTEGSIALNARAGRIRSPWWSFAPEQSLYLQDPQPLTGSTAPEFFVAAGAKLKARVYNAFLQGQLRHSEVRHSADELNPLLAEVWVGLVLRRASGLELRYLARWGSPELRRSEAARELWWGSAQIIRPFGH